MAYRGTGDANVSSSLQLPLEEEGHGRLEGFAEDVLPAFLPVRGDWTRAGGGGVGREPEASCQDSESQHVKRIADQKRAL